MTSGHPKPSQRFEIPPKPVSRSVRYGVRLVTVLCLAAGSAAGALLPIVAGRLIGMEAAEGTAIMGLAGFLAGAFVGFLSGQLLAVRVFRLSLREVSQLTRI